VQGFFGFEGIPLRCQRIFLDQAAEAGKLGLLNQEAGMMLFHHLVYRLRGNRDRLALLAQDWLAHEGKPHNKNEQGLLQEKGNRTLVH
jgi:hypothetical protein